MGYLTLMFAVFVIILMLIYYILPKKCRPCVLLIGSLFFYGCFDLRYFAFLLVVAVTTFFAAQLIMKTEKRKLILFLCIAVNVVIWFVVKELPWAYQTILSMLSKVDIHIPQPEWNLLVPIGISYYMLQAIAYLADVYMRRQEAEKNFGKYLLFLSYFPAIVQGPISRYGQLLPQLINSKRISYENVRQGCLLILFGLVKKMVLADRLGIFVNYCFDNYSDLHGVSLYLGAVFYSVQLYADFSGCVDICRGVSQLFGINLIHNFKRPYRARSIKEFWGKWHISLSSWLKDYIYIPLGGNRKGTSRKYVNILITFLISGIWHGSGFNYIFWGLLHGVYQIVEAATEPVRNKIKNIIGVKAGSISERIYQTLITFHLVTFAWIFFRAPGLNAGIQYVKNMFISADLWTLFDGSLYTYGVSIKHLVLLLLHIAVLMIVEHKCAQQEDFVQRLVDKHLVIRWCVYWTLIFDVLLFGVYGTGYTLSSFMYGGF